MMTKRIYTRNSVVIEVKPLVPGGEHKLVVSVSTGIVREASADGTNEALTALTELHDEVGCAINALIAKRAEIQDLRERGEFGRDGR